MENINQIFKIVGQNIRFRFVLNYLSLNSNFLFKILTVGIVLLGIYLLIILLLKIFLLRQRINKKYTILEVKPLQVTEQSEYTTLQLFNLIHSLARQGPFIDKILNNGKYYSFEIVSTKDEGIRYLIRVKKEDSELLKRSLFSYLPGISVKETNDYLSKSILDNKSLAITNFKLSNHFAYPLKKQNLLEEHDPIAYITGNMTKLNSGELVAFQIVSSPLSQQHAVDIKKIKEMIYNDSDLRSGIDDGKRGFSLLTVFKVFVFAFLHILVLPIGILVFIASGGKDGPFLSLRFNNKNKKTGNVYQEELEKLVKEKLDQQLFTTSLRLLVISNNKTELERRKNGFISSVSSFSNLGYQSLISFFNVKLNLIQKVKTYFFKQRILGVFGQSVLSASEIADIYHLPFTSTTKTEGLVKSKSGDLPAPLSLKRDTTSLDVVVGNNRYGGEETPVGLTQAQRHEHTYIVGKTGMGKTTIIKQMAYQDILSGKGVAVIDPHGDLVKELLSVIPDKRKKDVIYLDPTDKLWPVGLNILFPGGTFVDEEEKADWITGSVISVFMKITPKANWGQRMEHILRNATMTALTTESPTLMTIQKLLTNKEYRQQVTASLKDPVLKQFWTDEFKMFGNMQKADMISPLTNKLGEFITSPMSRHILLQAESTIKFSDIMDQGKVLLVNLSKGNLGEERSSFFGTLIISLIQMAAYQRAQIPESKRKDFFLYIDEFQNFANAHFADIFSEARKFHVFIIPSHQNVAQIEDIKTAKVVLGNSGTIISLKNGPDDEAVILPFMEPEVEKGQIVNLPPYHFFMKVTNEDSEDAFSGETVPLDIEGSDRIRDFIIASTRKNYATSRAVVEKQLDILFGVSNKPEEKTSKNTGDDTNKTNGEKRTNTGGRSIKKSDKQTQKRGLKS